MNPETNPKLRAVLYVIGVGGLVHLATLLVISVIRGDAAYFHPLYTIDVDQLWPSARNNWLIYVAGWLVFFTLIVLAYRWLRRRR